MSADGPLAMRAGLNNARLGPNKSCGLFARSTHGLADLDLDYFEIKGRLPQGTRAWRMSVEEIIGRPSSFRCLSTDELLRANSYRQPGDRERFLAARILLRHALSIVAAGRILPRQWRFCEGPNGKPMVQSGFPRIEFNLSHTDDCAAVGISSMGPIGIDIENLRSVNEANVIYEALTDREQLFLERCADRLWGFVTLWTLKEACAKALGLGATLDFREIEIGLNPPRLLNAGTLLGPRERIALRTMTTCHYSIAYRLSLATLICD